MLSLYFCKWLLILSFRQFLTCVFFHLLPRLFCIFLCRRLRTFAARLLYIQGGLQIQCFLHAPALVSKLFQVRRRKHNVHGTQKHKPACGDPWRGDSQACSVLNKKYLKRQFVDDHHPSPSYTATERDYRRTKPPYKVAIPRLQDTFILWDEHFIRHSPGQCVPDGPQQKLNERIG